MTRVTALGLMSGTSMDGVDAAIVTTNGLEDIEFGPVGSLDYPSEVRAALLDARGWSPAPQVERLIEDWHGPSRFENHAFRPELIGFHGQTLAHDPDAGRTLQAGDGARLARAWGVPVVWDFRTPDMQAGGQGAPLAPLFHFYALKSRGATGPAAILNLGGVGNVTWCDLDCETPTAPDAILAFDTGPANALMDDVMRQRLGQGYDKDGALAARGAVNPAMVAQALADPFFGAAAPKSLDRDHFGVLLDVVAVLDPQDALATLNAITCATVAAARPHFPKPATTWYVTGGGRRNATLMQGLRQALNAPVRDIDDIGLNGDMLEAQAFAWLAVRVQQGLPTSLPSTTGCATPTSGGKISHP